MEERPDITKMSVEKLRDTYMENAMKVIDSVAKGTDSLAALPPEQQRLEEERLALQPHKAPRGRGAKAQQQQQQAAMAAAAARAEAQVGHFVCMSVCLSLAFCIFILVN